ncbi:hypothetical protein QE436_002768 [Pantoea anthophila]|nr:hypothetical protein [Pantoea anthophila]
MKRFSMILCGLMVAFNASAGRVTMSNAGADNYGKRANPVRLLQ